jgi:hypothetical protein
MEERDEAENSAKSVGIDGPGAVGQISEAGNSAATRDVHGGNWVVTAKDQRTRRHRQRDCNVVEFLGEIQIGDSASYRFPCKLR